MQESTLSNIAIVIPAYQPNEKLEDLVEELRAKRFSLIIAVNDGSSGDKKVIFQKLKEKGVIVIEHAKNLGKGEALKTAFRLVVEDFPKIESIITVDADGQHLPKDVARVGEAASRNPRNFILGVRNFSTKIPFRSQFGNLMTKALFFLLTGKYIKDTQTGLRAISREFIRELLETRSQRYEFEMEMLHLAVKHKLPIEQVDIETVYENNNKSSHFDPLADSLKVYSVLFKYSVVSLLSAALDYVLFLFFYKTLGEIFTASLLARSLAVFFNFTAARGVVFKSHKDIWKTSFKYLILVVVNPLITSSAIFLLDSFLHISPAYGKIIAESIMFFINFKIQKRYVF